MEGVVPVAVEVMAGDGQGGDLVVAEADAGEAFAGRGREEPGPARQPRRAGCRRTPMRRPRADLGGSDGGAPHRPASRSPPAHRGVVHPLLIGSPQAAASAFSAGTSSSCIGNSIGNSHSSMAGNGRKATTRRAGSGPAQPARQHVDGPHHQPVMLLPSPAHADPRTPALQRGRDRPPRRRPVVLHQPGRRHRPPAPPGTALVRQVPCRFRRASLSPRCRLPRGEQHCPPGLRSPAQLRARRDRGTSVCSPTGQRRGRCRRRGCGGRVGNDHVPEIPGKLHSAAQSPIQSAECEHEGEAAQREEIGGRDQQFDAELTQ